MAEKVEMTTYTEEEIRNVVETIYDVAVKADHYLWSDEDVSEAVAARRTGLRPDVGQVRQLEPPTDIDDGMSRDWRDSDEDDTK